MSKSPLPYLLFAFALVLACVADWGPSDAAVAQAVADDAQAAPADVATQAQADYLAQRVARAYPQGGAQ